MQGLPGIAEVAAFAVPSDVLGAEYKVMVAVVANLGATVDSDAIYRLASDQLPRFAEPRDIRVMAELPKTATGKVQRAVLRKEGSAGALTWQRVVRNRLSSKCENMLVRRRD